MEQNILGEKWILRTKNAELFCAWDATLPLTRKVIQNVCTSSVCC